MPSLDDVLREAIRRRAQQAPPPTNNSAPNAIPVDPASLMTPFNPALLPSMYQMQFSGTTGSGATNPQAVPQARYDNGAGDPLQQPMIIPPRPYQPGYRSQGQYLDPSYQMQVGSSVGQRAPASVAMAGAAATDPFFGGTGDPPYDPNDPDAMVPDGDYAGTTNRFMWSDILRSKMKLGR